MNESNGASWTTSDLLTDVYRAARLPETGTVDYSPATVLRIATDVVWNWAGSVMSGSHEGRMVAEITRDIIDGTDATRSEFALPRMGAGDTLDSVWWQDSSGRQRRLALISVSISPDLFPSPSTDSAGTPSHYALLDGGVRIFPRPTSGTLKYVYQRRHSELVIGSSTAVVLAVTQDGGGNAVLQVSSTPSDWSVGCSLDVISGSYPYRYKIHGLTVQGSASNLISTDVPYATAVNAVLVGATAALYGKIPYVQLPFEMRSPLVNKIAAQIAVELGDNALAQTLDSLGGAAGQRVADLLSPRTKNDRQKVFSVNSLMRRGMFRQLRRGTRD